MKHSARIVNLSPQRLAYGSMPLGPAETRLRVQCFFQGTISLAKHRRNNINAA